MNNINLNTEETEGLLFGQEDFLATVDDNLQSNLSNSSGSTTNTNQSNSREISTSTDSESVISSSQTNTSESNFADNSDGIVNTGQSSTSEISSTGDATNSATNTGTINQSSTINDITADGTVVDGDSEIDLASSSNFSTTTAFLGQNGKDTYQLEVGQSGEYELSLGNLSANLDLNVSNDQGQVLYSSAQAESQAESITADLEPGSYTINVTGAEDVSTEYRLSITSSSSNESPSGNEESLAGTGDTVYKFFRADAQTEFYTTDMVERDYIQSNLSSYEYQGESFISAPEPEGDELTGLTPVYRLLNANTGVHLYTPSAVERDYVTENLDNYASEGIAYYSYDSQESGTVPLYRFYNQGLDAHFYTPSSDIRDSYLDSPDYQPEGGENGIAFYVNPIEI